MPAITLRSVKGSDLTYNEMDDNFSVCGDASGAFFTPSRAGVNGLGLAGVNNPALYANSVKVIDWTSTGVTISQPLTISSIAGGIKQTGAVKARFENTSASVPSGSAGVGLEIGIDTGVSVIMSYNRTTAAYGAMLLNALSHSIQTGAFGEAIGISSGGVVKIPGLGAYAAGDKYVLADAGGNLHVSATGPGS